MDKLISCCFTATEKNQWSYAVQSPPFHSFSASQNCHDLLSSLRGKSPAEPVTTQPLPTGAIVSSITTIVSTGGNWSTGLFDVCSDKRICVCGALCSPCLECSLASRHGECFCFPLLLGSTLALRVSTRERHKIRGGLTEVEKHEVNEAFNATVEKN
nr:PLAC8-like protein 1 [Pogona vitticeps]